MPAERPVPIINEQEILPTIDPDTFWLEERAMALQAAHDEHSAEECLETEHVSITIPERSTKGHLLWLRANGERS